ncbi:MAG TPA: PDC sensor domain-containing protein [Thermoanaerobaculia bacterium]|jgi:hypothetical protein|nr:PDC sensor domain-containing protein [Thermoanaerobaculia bacterium]
MRQPPIALTGRLSLACVLLALSSPLLAQSQTTAAPPRPAAGAAVQFEDEALAAADRDVLARAAQQVGRWAMIQRVVQAVKAQEASPPAMERVRAIDAAWQRGEDPEGLATSLAKNDCAQALQTLMSANPGYGDAYVTDHQGAIVCMTDRTSDYWHGDEEAWTRAYAGGAGAVVVGKNERDATTGLDVVPISVPIKSAGQVIGVLTVGRIAAPPVHASPG